MLALTLTLVSGNAHAQLGLPSLRLPLPQLGPLDPERLGRSTDRLLARGALPELAPLRLNQVTALLRTHRAELEADPRGEPIVRRELLAFSPGPAALARARAAGFEVLRQRTLEPLGETLVVLRVPPNTDSAAALALLREADPDGSYDFNHLYTGSGAGSAEPAPPGTLAQAPRGAAARRAIGLIDSGVDTDHDVFGAARIERWGCEGTAHPSEHGTAVAALMVGRATHFRGVAPGATLFAADIYCDSPTGGSADRIAGALAWMASRQVGVINLSLVGPANRTLERVVAAMVQRGHLLVAAVGNDGPAAPPLFPASYPGVVGVSAVDRQGRPLAEAARGPQVMFAAPGNNMVSAAPGAPPYRQVRGTSFAAPIVAALLAAELGEPDQAGARRAISTLAAQAKDAVRELTGLGIVGQAYRIDPAALR